jgi:pimeloyl-ACP methyl ester carboxylesterase
MEERSNANNMYEKYYRKASPKQVDRLKKFRSTHPYKRLVTDGITWQYTAGGQGERALLVLTGGLGVGEAAAFVFANLENEYRVISPSYPLFVSIEQLVNGFVDILGEEGIYKVHVLGQSLGGMLAQVMVRKYPERASTLILSHTFPTSPPADRAIIQERQAKEKKLLKLFPWFPFWMIRLVTRKRLARLVALMNTPEKGFWEAYLYEATAGITREHFRSNFMCGADFYQNYVFTKDDLESWSGKVLILESDNDISHTSEREALKELYPQAQVHTFHGTGHLTLLVAQEELLDVVRNFLGNRQTCTQ